VIVRNLLNDYQALVYVERDNFIVREDAAEDRTLVHYGNYEAYANITIEENS